MHFTSDNASGAHPKVLDAVLAANAGYAMAYGGDPLTDGVVAEVRRVLEAPEAAVYLVATGTAANALALACCCPPWAAVYCHRNAHVEEDECGAPEFYTGGSKLVLVDGDHAKMTPEGLARAIGFTGRAGVHNVQRGMVTVTNATEAGTVYTPAEVAALAEVARADGLPVHMDGARFANALVALGCSPAEMTWKAGVDAVSFGATKNGAMGVEAVVLFDPDKAWEFELRRKRGGHLFSKMRFISAQMEAYLTDDLWLRLAGDSNRMADLLAEGINAANGSQVTNTVGANMLFPDSTLAQHKRLQAVGAGYYTMSEFDPDGSDDQIILIRLVASFRTTEDDVARFSQALAG